MNSDDPQLGDQALPPLDGEEMGGIPPEEMSSEVSALTDEQHVDEQLKQERLKEERAEREARNMQSQVSLAQIFLSSSRRRYMYLAKNHNVNGAISSLWDILPKNSSDAVPVEHVESLLLRMMKVLLPGFDHAKIERLCLDFIGAHKMRESPLFLQEEFFEVMLNLADHFLENLDVDNGTTFFEFILNRVTQSIILKKDGTRTVIQQDFRVKFFNTSACNRQFKEELLQPKQPENVIYCYEWYSKPSLTEIGNDDTIITEFRRLEDLPTLGLAADAVISALQNGRLLENPDNVDSPQELSVLLSKTERLFYLAFVMEAQDSHLIRLTPALFAPYFFEELRDKQGAKVIINQRSIYMKKKEIDRIHEMTKRWNDKLVVPSPAAEELWDKDFEDIFHILYLNKFRLNGKADEDPAIRELNFTTSDTFPQINSERFQNFETRESTLPFDSTDPFGEDLLELAKDRPFHILVHGKPKIGKSIFCKQLAERLKLEWIDADTFVARFLKRMLKREENKVDDPVLQDADGNDLPPVPKQITWDEEVLIDLRSGQRIKEEHLLLIIQDGISRLRVDHKGCVFEAPCFGENEKGLNLILEIVNKRLTINAFDPVFNVILELYVPDDQLSNRSRQLRENRGLENMIMKTEAELLTPPDKPVDDDSNQQDDEDALQIKPENLYNRVNECDVVVQRGLLHYKENVRPIINVFEKQVHHLNNIFVDFDTLSPAQALDVVCSKLLPHSKFLRPVAEKMEEAPEEEEDVDLQDKPDDEEPREENYASLLTEFKGEEVEGRPPRSWSLFGVYDPVALYHKKVLKGYSNFSCEYAGRIFCFNERKNMEEFYRNPQPYIGAKPSLPREYNIAILGPHNSGKHLFASKIAALYGLEIVNLADLIFKKYEAQNKWETHIANSLDNGLVHFSKGEFADLKKGAPIDIAKALPLLLHERGVKLQKRPPPPKDPDQVDADDKQKKDAEDKLLQDAKNKKKAAVTAKKDEKKEEVKEPTVVAEDIPLSDLIPHIDYKNDVPGLKGFLFIDFPSKEEHVNLLKEMKIELDRVIILSGPLTQDEVNEDYKGTPLFKRPNFYNKTTVDDEKAFVTGNDKVPGLETLKTVLADKFQEIESKDVDETFFKIRQYIDPFCPRVDDPEMYPAEVSEKIVFGEFGKYCPITAVDDKWLVLGNPDFAVQVRGKTYRFYTEVEKLKFEANIEKYLSNEFTVPPPPRIFLLGSTGSGITSHINHLREKLKIPVLKFKNELEKLVVVGKKQRRQERYNKKFMKFPEDGNLAAELEADEDPNVENDPDDFMENELKKVTSKLLDRLDAALINLRLSEPSILKDLFPEDPKYNPALRKKTDEDGKALDNQDETPEEFVNYDSLASILKEIKRLPEILIILKVSEAEMLKRRFNEGKIKVQFEGKRRELENKRGEVRMKALQEYEDRIREKKDQDAGDGDPDQQEEPPNFENEDFVQELYNKAELPEMPKFEEMKEEEIKKLKAQLEDENNKMDAFKELMQEACIKVEIFEANKSEDKVFKKITDLVSKVLEDRESLYERDSVFEVTETETLTIEKVINLEIQSQLTKESRFGYCNAMSPNRVVVNNQFPLLYKNRIYYLGSIEERDIVKWNPKKYISCEPAPPKDIPLRPKIYLLGKYKSGKSTVGRKACEELGLTYLNIPEILELFAKNKYYGKGMELFTLLATGGTPSDELIVDLLRLRLEFSDCIEKGFIIENFPRTKKQAMLMYKNLVHPDLVIYESTPAFEIKQRALQGLLNEDLFEYDNEILDLRLKAEQAELDAVVNLFNYNFGNVRRLQKRSVDSKVAELSFIIEEYIRGRQRAAVGINLKRPFEITHLSIKKSTIMKHIGPSLTFSPISLKKYGAIEQMFLRSDIVLYFDELYYLVKDREQADSFIRTPDSFADVVAPVERIVRVPSLRESFEKNVKLRQYCPVELLHKRLVKGNRHLSLLNKNSLFFFSSIKAMRTFFKNPYAFSSVRLPEKIKVGIEKSEVLKEAAAKSDLQTYIHNELSKLIVKALNHASKFRLKYPTISVHSTALKLVALCLKASNPQSSEAEKISYQQKIKDFISDCMLAQQIKDEVDRRSRYLLSR
jgi:adenylate/nucleoside-diphosphate kinase